MHPVNVWSSAKSYGVNQHCSTTGQSTSWELSSKVYAVVQHCGASGGGDGLGGSGGGDGGGGVGGGGLGGNRVTDPSTWHSP